MVSENPRVKLGDNQPPADPHELMATYVSDLMETAQGFLDGEPVANQETADLIGKLIADARQAQKDAEEMRKEEAKPFDDGKKIVQAKWTPITDEKKGKCALIISTAKQALKPWLDELDRQQREAAKKAAEEAEAARQHAAELERQSSAVDLAAQEAIAEARKEAEQAQREANRADKAKAHVAGGGRAIGLRTVWKVELSEPLTFGKWLWENRRDDYIAFLNEQAQAECGRGESRPGVVVTQEKVL